MNTIAKTALLGAGLSMLAACGHRVTEREIVREQPIVQQQQQPTTERIVIVQQPPAMQEPAPPAPAATGYTWVPGRYLWRDGRWQWESGQWVAGVVRPMPPALQE